MELFATLLPSQFASRDVSFPFASSDMNTLMVDEVFFLPALYIQPDICSLFLIRNLAYQIYF